MNDQQPSNPPLSEDAFSDEYRFGTGTEAISPTETGKPEMKIEMSKYGIAKPKRILIRARTIHDKD